MNQKKHYGLFVGIAVALSAVSFATMSTSSSATFHDDSNFTDSLDDNEFYSLENSGLLEEKVFSRDEKASSSSSLVITTPSEGFAKKIQAPDTQTSISIIGTASISSNLEIVLHEKEYFTKADSNGDWSIETDLLEPREYTANVKEIKENGEVTESLVNFFIFSAEMHDPVRVNPSNEGDKITLNEGEIARGISLECVGQTDAIVEITVADKSYVTPIISGEPCVINTDALAPGEYVAAASQTVDGVTTRDQIKFEILSAKTLDTTEIAQKSNFDSEMILGEIMPSEIKPIETPELSEEEGLGDDFQNHDLENSDNQIYIVDEPSDVDADEESNADTDATSEDYTLSPFVESIDYVVEVYDDEDLDSVAPNSTSDSDTSLNEKEIIQTTNMPPAVLASTGSDISIIQNIFALILIITGVGTMARRKRTPRRG